MEPKARQETHNDQKNPQHIDLPVESLLSPFYSKRGKPFVAIAFVHVINRTANDEQPVDRVSVVLQGANQN